MWVKTEVEDGRDAMVTRLLWLVVVDKRTSDDDGAWCLGAKAQFTFSGVCFFKKIVT